MAYIPRSKRKDFDEKTSAIPLDDPALSPMLLSRVRRNSHAHGLESDPRFVESYAFRRAWRRNAGYWLVLYERSDPAVKPELDSGP